MALTGVRMAPRARRSFTAEFKAETVALIRTSEKGISASWSFWLGCCPVPTDGDGMALRWRP